MSDYYKCDDVINRLQEITKDYEHAGYMDSFYVADYCLHRIMELHPITNVVERKGGKWIKYKGRACWYCSECGEDNYYAYSWSSDIGKNKFQDNYCPNCGAEMDEVKE